MEWLSTACAKIRQMRISFLFSMIRSGSTLLRCLLDSHTNMVAPPELHVSEFEVRPTNAFAIATMSAFGLGEPDLEGTLRDGFYQRALAAAHPKTHLVDKTPSNIERWEQLLEQWPDARSIVLVRNPSSVVRSILDMQDGWSIEAAVSYVVSGGEALDAIAATQDHIWVRYEDLTHAPETTMRRICEYLGEQYEPGMLEYGSFEHGPLIYGAGDWGRRIESGQILTPDERRAPRTAETKELRALGGRWGYTVGL